VQSIIVYILLFVFVILFGYIGEKRESKSVVFSIVFILSLVAGLRAYSVGRDTISYVDIFSYAEKGQFEYIYGEEGFKYFCSFLTKICENPSFIFLVIAILTNLLIVFRLYDFRHQASFTWMVGLYYVLFYFMTLNIIRQFLAVAIVFYASRYLKNNKYLRFLVAIGIATLFHTSSLVGIGFLAVEVFQWKWLNYRQRLFFGMVFACTPIVVVYVLSCVGKYAHYFVNVTADIGMMLIVKVLLFVFSLIAFQAEVCRESKKSDSGMITVYELNCVRTYYIIGINVRKSVIPKKRETVRISGTIQLQSNYRYQLLFL